MGKVSNRGSLTSGEPGQVPEYPRRPGPASCDRWLPRSSPEFRRWRANGRFRCVKWSLDPRQRSGRLLPGSNRWRGEAISIGYPRGAPTWLLLRPSAVEIPDRRYIGCDPRGSRSVHRLANLVFRRILCPLLTVGGGGCMPSLRKERCCATQGLWRCLASGVTAVCANSLLLLIGGFSQAAAPPHAAAVTEA